MRMGVGDQLDVTLCALRWWFNWLGIIAGSGFGIALCRVCYPCTHSQSVSKEAMIIIALYFMRRAISDVLS